MTAVVGTERMAWPTVSDSSKETIQRETKESKKHQQASPMPCFNKRWENNHNTGSSKNSMAVVDPNSNGVLCEDTEELLLPWHKPGELKL